MPKVNLNQDIWRERICGNSCLEDNRIFVTNEPRSGPFLRIDLASRFNLTQCPVPARPRYKDLTANWSNRKLLSAD